MNSHVLEQMIAQKDAEAVRLARQLGPHADTVVLRSLSDADPEVREVAVACVDAAGGPDREDRLIRALGDVDVNVRDAALGFLRPGVGRASLPALLEQLQTNEDDHVRGEVALIIGRLDDPSAVEALQAQAALEPDPDARSSQVLAMARLGDQEALLEVRQGLQHEDPQMRFAAVQKYEYIGNPRLLSDLRPILADHAEVLNVRPSHLGRYYLRLCDIVVHVVTRVGDPPFSFDGTERRRFSPQELSQVANWLDR